MHTNCIILIPFLPEMVWTFFPYIKWHQSLLLHTWLNSGYFHFFFQRVVNFNIYLQPVKLISLSGSVTFGNIRYFNTTTVFIIFSYLHLFTVFVRCTKSEPSFLHIVSKYNEILQSYDTCGATTFSVPDFWFFSDFLIKIVCPLSADTLWLYNVWELTRFWKKILIS